MTEGESLAVNPGPLGKNGSARGTIHPSPQIGEIGENLWFKTLFC
jgi:hypothetical protein